MLSRAVLLNTLPQHLTDPIDYALFAYGCAENSGFVVVKSPPPTGTSPCAHKALPRPVQTRLWLSGGAKSKKLGSEGEL